MKNRNQRQPDLETLSAYLDHELSEAEEQTLRSRLSQDTTLQHQLDDLRQTRYVLRHTPKVKRPRSFVLSPEMVRQQRFAAGAWNVSRWVSAVASALLIVAIGGQYLLSGSRMAGSAPMQDIAFSSDEAIEQTAAEEPVEEPMMAMEAPAEEATAADDAMDTGMAEEGDANLPEEPTMQEEMPAAAEMAPQPTPTLEGTIEPGGGGGLPPSEAEPAATEEILGIGSGPTETPIPEELRTAPSDKIGEADGQNAAAPEQPVPQQIAPDEGVETQQLPQPISGWRLAQAGLLTVALIAAITAAYYRKKVR